MRSAFAILLLFFMLLPLPARAARHVGEGYAIPTYKELYQTMVMLGAVDITNQKVADEYGRLMYCAQYKESFSNDSAWNRVRKEIIDRVTDKKDYYRILYEVVGVFKLGRYNFEGKYFPLISETALKNVGSMPIFSPLHYKRYCDGGDASKYFPATVALVLNRPLTLTQLDFPPDNLDKMLARMAETKNAERYLFGRVRFRILDARLETDLINFLGEIQSIDFFLDRDLTKPIASVQIVR